MGKASVGSSSSVEQDEELIKPRVLFLEACQMLEQGLASDSLHIKEVSQEKAAQGFAACIASLGPIITQEASASSKWA